MDGIRIPYTVLPVFSSWHSVYRQQYNSRERYGHRHLFQIHSTSFVAQRSNGNLAMPIPPRPSTIAASDQYNVRRHDRQWTRRMIIIIMVLSPQFSAFGTT